MCFLLQTNRCLSSFPVDGNSQHGGNLRGQGHRRPRTCARRSSFGAIACLRRNLGETSQAAYPHLPRTIVTSLGAAPACLARMCSPPRRSNSTSIALSIGLCELKHAKNAAHLDKSAGCSGATRGSPEPRTPHPPPSIFYRASLRTRPHHVGNSGRSET